MAKTTSMFDPTPEDLDEAVEYYRNMALGGVWSQLRTTLIAKIDQLQTAKPAPEQLDLRHIPTKVGRNEECVFVPLPPELQLKAFDGKCGCPHCKGTNASPAMWDTLAVPTNGGTTWLVHYPELQPKR